MDYFNLSNLILLAAGGSDGDFHELAQAAINFIKDIMTKSGGFLTQTFYLISGAVDIVPVNAVTSLGVALTSLFFCIEIFSQVAQFRVERIEDAIRIAMKFIIAKIVIENSSNIAGGIYQMFRIATNASLTQVFNNIGSTFEEVLVSDTGGGLMGIGFILLFLGAIGICLVFLVLFIKIIISFVGIAFEIGIHQAVAPIALSTLCNDMARSTGIAYIKSFAATCLQVTVMAAIFQVFGDMYSHLITFKFGDPSGLGIFAGLVKFIVPIIMMMALSKAIKTATDLTKRMFGV